MNALATLAIKTSNWLAKRAQSWSGVHPRDPALVELFGYGSYSSSGERITPESAMRYGAVYACVKVLSQSIAQLPLKVYRRLPGGGREPAPEHRLSRLLGRKPNGYQTSYHFREMLMPHLLLRGNAYALRQSAGDRVDIALIPVHPDRVVPFWAAPGVRAYRVRGDSGAERVVRQDDMLHIPNSATEDGLKGMGVIEALRESVGIGIAAEKFAGRFWSNGAKPGGLLEHPGQLSDPARENIKKSWNDAHQGPDRAHKVALLEEGMKYHETAITPEDGQFLETRNYQDKDIARLFRVPMHMINDLANATFSNIEHQSLEFVKYTLAPWLVCWEQVINAAMFFESEQDQFFAEFNVDGMLRGDFPTRMQGYSIAINGGWMSANEVRALENFNPIPDDQDGDVIFVPMNMVPRAQAIAEPEPAPEPDMTPLDEDQPDEGDDDEGEDGEDDGEANAVRMLRARQTRAVKSRQRYQKSFRSIFKRTAKALLGREVAGVDGILGRYPPEAVDVADFDARLSGFYDAHHRDIRDTMLPVVTSYMAAIGGEAAAEIGAGDGAMAGLDTFAEEYSETLATRTVASSRNQLAKVLRDAAAALVAEAVRERLAEWQETRPDKIASREVIQAGAAAARNVYQEAGIRRLRWVTVGGNCPLCNELNGRVVGIETDFLGAGETLQAEGVEPLTPRRTVRHPPLHQGCNCQIVAE